VLPSRTYDVDRFTSCFFNSALSEGRSHGQKPKLTGRAISYQEKFEHHGVASCTANWVIRPHCCAGHRLRVSNGSKSASFGLELADRHLICPCPHKSPARRAEKSFSEPKPKYAGKMVSSEASSIDFVLLESTPTRSTKQRKRLRILASNERWQTLGST
jgi:hypothetical protein